MQPEVIGGGGKIAASITAIKTHAARAARAGAGVINEDIGGGGGGALLRSDVAAMGKHFDFS